MQNPPLSSCLDDRHDNFQPKETTPLIPPGLGSKRVRSYTNTLSSSSKRRLRLQPRLFKQNDKLDPVEVAEEPSPHSSPSSESHSTLVPCSTSRDPSPSWQSTCGPSPDDACCSSPSRRRNESLMSKLSLTLENQGSVARDHLASERTFLAYVRTSLAIASSGVGRSIPVYRHDKLTEVELPSSAGVVRYFSVQAALTKGRFPVARVGTSFITSVLVMLVISTFGILVAGKLEPPKGRHPEKLSRF
ncbi:hypothetical protein H0H87_004608 [Tephrocybe sp. NHM501043]|nr:hypothetical protein H0H87_004608 [Tephrocybe sp. NHM501043]